MELSKADAGIGGKNLGVDVSVSGDLYEIRRGIKLNIAEITLSIILDFAHREELSIEITGGETEAAAVVARDDLFDIASTGLSHGASDAPCPVIVGS